MPNKALLNGAPVFADTVAGTGEYLCAECDAKMYYKPASKRNGIRVRSHFAHYPVTAGSAPRDCSSLGMSDEHRNAQTTIRLTAPGYFWWLFGCVGDEEHNIDLSDGTRRRADVYFERTDGRRIVFEPQFTKIPPRKIAERTRDYHDMGCDVIWCLGGKCLAHYDWLKRHFYCTGQMSDDGNEVTFWGNLNPDKYPPGLRAKFDDETDPDAWKRAIAPSFDEVPWGDYRPGIAHNVDLSVYRKPDPMPSIAKPPRTMMRDSSAENAYKAWTACGSMGISRWLLDYKERTTGKRFCTVEEMGYWIEKVRTIELERTGENSEFCRGS